MSGTEPSRIRPAGECLAAAVRDLGAAGIDLPVLEAQMLLAEAVGAERHELYRLSSHGISACEERDFAELVRQRCGRRPMAYIRRRQEFYGLVFEVTDDVLVPRPETELLVDCAVAVTMASEAPVVIDAGTGTGCIAVSVGVQVPSARVIALDVSPAALAVARRNIARHGLAGRVAALRSDMLAAVRPGSVDLVLSNPPYIPSAEIDGLQPEVRDYEPRGALDGGVDGLVYHRRVAAGAARVLMPGGRLAVEVAYEQAEQVIALHEAAGLEFERTYRDLAGIDRVVVSRVPAGRVRAAGGAAPQ